MRGLLGDVPHNLKNSNYINLDIFRATSPFSIVPINTVNNIKLGQYLKLGPIFSGVTNDNI